MKRFTDEEQSNAQRQLEVYHKRLCHFIHRLFSFCLACCIRNLAILWQGYTCHWMYYMLAIYHDALCHQLCIMNHVLFLNSVSHCIRSRTIWTSYTTAKSPTCFVTSNRISHIQTSLYEWLLCQLLLQFQSFMLRYTPCKHPAFTLYSNPIYTIACCCAFKRSLAKWMHQWCSWYSPYVLLAACSGQHVWESERMAFLEVHLQMGSTPLYG